LGGGALVAVAIFANPVGGIGAAAPNTQGLKAPVIASQRRNVTVAAGARARFAASAKDEPRPMVACPVTRQDPLGAGTSRPRVVTGTSEELQVTVPPLVFVTVESGVLRVSTNTGGPPATTDGFYLIRRGRADPAPADVVETVLRSCG
jgi:hypothetical protein